MDSMAKQAKIQAMYEQKAQVLSGVLNSVKEALYSSFRRMEHESFADLFNLIVSFAAEELSEIYLISCQNNADKATSMVNEDFHNLSDLLMGKMLAAIPGKAKERKMLLEAMQNRVNNEGVQLDE